jgi:CRP-like cAMP-binding protein
LLEALSPTERELVEARLRPRRYQRGQTVFNDGDVGDCLHLVSSGRLDVQGSTPDGVVVTFRVIHPGEFFGELALVHPDNRRTGRVTALEPTTTAALHRDDFEELRQRHPAVDRLLVAALAERLVRTSELVVEQLMAPDTRLWRRLAVLAEAYGSEPIRMSQDDLARAAGTVRQTVNRALRHAAQLGVVEVSRGSVRVLDRAGLDRLARS